MAEDSKQEPKIKVTDKRMFTADGELREDYRHLQDAGGDQTPDSGGDAAAVAGRSSPGTTAAARAPEAPEPAPAAESPRPDETSERAPVEMPGTPGELGTPGVMDLISLLAEPIAIYLGDAKLPDGSSAENLEAARFYIDLLEVLRTKTAGNLTAQESTLLEDLLYQLRMRYVRKLE